jgi:ribosome maturation protein Sdo1
VDARDLELVHRTDDPSEVVAIVQRGYERQRAEERERPPPGGGPPAG